MIIRNGEFKTRRTSVRLAKSFYDCISEQRMGINLGDMANLAKAMDKMFAM